MQDFQQSPEVLLDAFASLCNDGKYYEAYALALDHYEKVELFIKMFSEESEPGELIGIFLLFCKEQDSDRAIKAAVILVDLYKRKNYLHKIIELSYHFTANIGGPLANTSSQLIMKEGITALVQFLDEITDTMPSDELMVFICANALCFPALSKDRSFSVPFINKLTAHYDCGHKARQNVIASFLPYIERGFTEMEQRYRGFAEIEGMDADELNKYADECREFLDMIFTENTPVFDGENPYVVNTNREKNAEFLDMLKEQELLRADILSLDEDNAVFPADLKKRHDILVDYFLNLDIPDSNVDIMREYLVVSCFAMCRYVDMEYTIKNIVSHAEALLAYEADDFTYTATIYHLQTTLLELSEVYELRGDDAARYRAYLKYMELGNVYFKRICFEDGLDYFIRSVQDEYFLYHSIVSKSLKVALDNELSLNPLYFEMSKRKNLVYLGEMWQRQGFSAVEISKLLEREFTFEDLRLRLAAKNRQRVLVDFFYIRIINDDEKEWSRDFIHDIKNFACFAFVVQAEGEVQFYIVDEGVNLAENISNFEDSTDYFKDIAEYVLQGIKVESLIVCADGDINQLNIAALPYLDSYVTDYFPVRNIGSVMDIVYPSKRTPIKSALLFNAPDYGEAEANDQSLDLDYLDGSEIEKEILTNTLTSKFGITVESLSGAEASKTALLSKIKKANGILHISTHGNIVDGAVAIVTAGANITEKDTSISDNEISSGYMENVSLAVFALCFGAKQAAALQDSLSGFIKASLLSGVNTVIAPIKRIFDISTVVLLNEFYKFYLLKQNEGGAYSAEQALQKAMKRTREISWVEVYNEYGVELEVKEQYPFSNPKHWAAWMCFSREES